MQKFGENPDVMFGDINLSQGGPGQSPKGGNHQAGAGGWPSVKYFNKETGYAGRPRFNIFLPFPAFVRSRDLGIPS